MRCRISRRCCSGCRSGKRSALPREHVIQHVEHLSQRALRARPQPLGEALLIDHADLIQDDMAILLPPFLLPGDERLSESQATRVSNADKPGLHMHLQRVATM
jgi:hypothetical protein